MSGFIFDDAFFDGLASSTREVLSAESLPPLCYTDTDFYAFEKEAIFAREWLCVGREEWVSQPGDYFTTAIADEPIIVARTQNMALKAMSAVCQHRAMLVAEGSGNVRGFVCPYHHWTYGLDGHLVNAPAMNKTYDFDKGKWGLPNFKLELWQGFIFINLDANAQPLGPRLSHLAEVLAPYDMASLTGPRPGPAGKFAWNWKVMFENNNDGYHANRLHRGPLHDFIPSRLARFPELNEDAAGYYRINGTTHPDASFNVTQKAILPIFPKLNEEQRNCVLFANIPPTLSLVITADMIIYLIVRPTGAQTLEMDTGLLFAPGAMQEPAFDDKMAMIMHAAGKIIAQDLHVDELVQVGLRSRFAVRGRYSWQEGAQREFNRWLVRRYRDYWNQTRVAPEAQARMSHPAPDVSPWR